MTEDVIDVEPIEPTLLGWCSTGNHITCPGYLPEQVWPDPVDRRKTYTAPAQMCRCSCHTRHTIQVRLG